MRYFACSLLVAFALLISCSDQTNLNSLHDLAYNGKTGKNVAVFLTAPNPWGNTHVYVENDPETLMSNITSLNQNFTHFQDENVTLESAINAVTKYSAIDQIGEDGTLFLYIAGHGSPDAQTQLTNGTFLNFTHLHDAIKTSRGGKPIKRLVLMVFSCYSGSWISRVQNGRYEEIAEQMFIMTSSAANQLSYSGGVNSHFVNAFHAVMKRYFENITDVSLNQFASDIQRSVGSSTPQHWASSQGVGNDTLFSRQALEKYQAAQNSGIMPTVAEHAAGRFVPSEETISEVGKTKPDRLHNCHVATIKDANGGELCAIWNRDDYEQKRNVFAFVGLDVNAGEKCSPARIYQSLDAERYKSTYEHCKGRAKLKKDATD